jgi:hypothetical protein
MSVQFLQIDLQFRRINKTLIVSHKQGYNTLM